MNKLTSLFSKNKYTQFSVNQRKTEYDNWLAFLSKGGTTEEWEKRKIEEKWTFLDVSYDSERKEEKSESTVQIQTKGNSITVNGLSQIVISSSTVGEPSGSEHKDFYVYEWYIKRTGEVFYVGKGRGNRCREYHKNSPDAEKIRSAYDTDIRIVAQGLTEEVALEVETEEMMRILNETNYRLVNRITPDLATRDNGYSRSINTPQYSFETAPVLFSCEIDEHYFGVKYKKFDDVELENLGNPSFVDKGISKEQIDIVYGGDYKKYYSEVVSMLERRGCQILRSRYAKSVSSWIYPCDDYVTNNELDEKKAEERLGRRVPAYHLIDVWKLLKSMDRDPVKKTEEKIPINPIHTRVPISKIRNRNNWEAGFDAGFKYWEEGDKERKQGNLQHAIGLLDLARFYGYFAPALYKSYAMAYRKMKDLDNEIAILDEAICRYMSQKGDYSQIIIMFENEKKKAVDKWKKVNER